MDTIGSIATMFSGAGSEPSKPSIRVLDFTAPQPAESLLARVFASALTDGPELADATMAILRGLAGKVRSQLEPIEIGPGRN